MRALITSFLAGVGFAVGLGVSGMTRPAKVVAFLDFAGDWDPSLALVMGSAVAVYALLYRAIIKRSVPLFASGFTLPRRRDIDAPLAVGAAIFGLGWGMVGFCPGPALTSLASGHRMALVFVIAMLAGMYSHLVAQQLWMRWKVGRQSNSDRRAKIPRMSLQK